MESFYGGKQGISFNIVKHFDDENQMIAFFKKGGENTTEVGYGEYVIIDTIRNRKAFSDKTNGKIYRRGMNYNNDLGGAEYIGQVVGPQGEVPKVEINSYNDIKTNNPNYTEKEYTVNNNDLIAGTESDKISYVYADILDEKGNIQGVQLGFKIPYLVVNFTADISERTVPNPIIDKKDSTPFYQSWHLNIPRGFRGTSVTNLKVLDNGEVEYILETEGKNTSSTTRESAGTINWIKSVVITTPDNSKAYNAEPYHLLVLYANNPKWVDLGYVRGEIGGLKIVMNIENESMLKNGNRWKTPEELLGEENWKDEYTGYAVTVGAETEKEKDIYVYDYVNNIWYSIGKISSDINSIITIKEKNESPILNNGGLWLIKETMLGVNNAGYLEK